MKLGIFGGAFDPIHNGHLFVAEAVRADVGLDRVLFVPTRAGPHRAPYTAAAHERAAMVRLAIASNTAFALDESDLDPEASGYTRDLLPRLGARYPDAEMIFIAGGDSLVRSTWRGLDAVLEILTEFVVAPRGTITQTELNTALVGLAPHLRKKVRLLDLPLVAESATLIRERLAARKTVRYLVPEPVFRYLAEHDLYGLGAPVIR